MVDAFRMHIMQTKELGTCPVRQIGGCSFLYMRISNVYIVIVVSSNANVACAFKFVVEVIRSFLLRAYQSICFISGKMLSLKNIFLFVDEEHKMCRFWLYTLFSENCLNMILQLAAGCESFQILLWWAV